jgi:hypothetical protein
MADTVARLIRLRAAEANAAARAVAAASRAQGEAEARLAATQRAIPAEAAAVPLGADHPLAGAFAAWLPAGQAAIRRAAMEEAARRAALETARSGLVAAKVALRACEALQEARAEAGRAVALKAEQVVMEEAAREKRLRC